jgi:hypothetical protein
MSTCNENLTNEKTENLCANCLDILLEKEFEEQLDRDYPRKIFNC